MSDVLWKLSNVVLQGEGHPRVDCVNLQIPAGVTAVLGSSGAGKTSLLNLLAGLEQPDSGSIERQFSSDSGRLPLYWVPQGGGLWPHLTVQQHLTEIGADTNSSDNLLAELGLQDHRSVLPGQLSQGERARLSLARALATEAQVLLLDEALAHVDLDRRQQGWRMIRRAISTLGTHLVLTTHEPEVVLQEAQHVVCVRSGRVVWQGEVKTLYHTPPDETCGRFLGPLNWFHPDDGQRWLNLSVTNSAESCVRPERCQLIPDDDDWTAEVVRSEFVGSRAETILRRRDSDEERRVLHRPSGPLSPGCRVSLQILPTVAEEVR